VFPLHEGGCTEFLALLGVLEGHIGVYEHCSGVHIVGLGMENMPNEVLAWTAYLVAERSSLHSSLIETSGQVLRNMELVLNFFALFAASECFQL